MVPDRAGADTRVDVHIGIRDLLEMDGASIIEDTWLRARAGEHGYLSGKDAEAASCDALIVPIVTGIPNWALISEMITLVTDAYHHASAKGGRPAPAPAVGGTAVRPRPPRDPVRVRPRRPRLRPAPQPVRPAPLNTKSVILDIGYSDTIPESIRRAVIARDKGCAWPGGCHRRPASLRRPPRQAQEARRQDQRQRLRLVVQLSP